LSEEYLYDTRHPALAALAWRVMERYPAGWLDSRLLELASEYSESAEVAEAHFLKLANNPHFVSRPLLFDNWAAREKPLSQGAFKALLQSERPWTRVLTYLHFGKRCDKAWADDLFRDLADLPKPIPADRYTRLLRELDSETFAVREKATAEFALYGERGEAQLRQALEGTLPPEAKRRVRQLLEEIAAAKKSPEWAPIVRDLGTTRKPEARALLTALSQGPPEAPLTKAAKTALEQHKELFRKLP
jgi:hypothetical protein